MNIGTYKAKVIEAALCRSRNNSDYIGTVFEVTEGDCKGERITGMMFWTDATQERTKKALEALGWKGEVTNDGTLTGLANVVPIGIIEDTYEGKKRLKVDWVFEPPTGINAKDKLSMRDAADFLRQMRAGLNGTKRQPQRGDAYEGDDNSPL